MKGKETEEKRNKTELYDVVNDACSSFSMTVAVDVSSSTDTKILGRSTGVASLSLVLCVKYLG